MDLAKIFSTAFIVIGAYYLIVAFKLIKTSVIWLKFARPSSLMIGIVGVILIILGIIMNKNFRKKIRKMLKNAFS